MTLETLKGDVSGDPSESPSDPLSLSSYQNIESIIQNLYLRMPYFIHTIRTGIGISIGIGIGLERPSVSVYDP